MLFRRLNNPWVRLGSALLPLLLLYLIVFVYCTFTEAVVAVLAARPIVKGVQFEATSSARSLIIFTVCLLTAECVPLLLSLWRAVSTSAGMVPLAFARAHGVEAKVFRDADAMRTANAARYSRAHGETESLAAAAAPAADTDAEPVNGGADTTTAHVRGPSGSSALPAYLRGRVAGRAAFHYLPEPPREEVVDEQPVLAEQAQGQQPGLVADAAGARGGGGGGKAWSGAGNGATGNSARAAASSRTVAAQLIVTVDEDEEDDGVEREGTAVSNRRTHAFPGLQQPPQPPVRRDGSYPNTAATGRLEGDYIDANHREVPPAVMAILTGRYSPGPHDVRWCRKCECVKPPRAHHCSMCGVCTLKMDHHCPVSVIMVCKSGTSSSSCYRRGLIPSRF